MEKLWCKVDVVNEKSVRCLVDFSGSILPISFPRTVIAFHGLVVGNEFEWSRVKGRPILPTDIRKIQHVWTMSKEEEKRLDSFVKRGKTLREILGD